VRLPGEVPDDDGAARPRQRQLGDVLVLVAGVVVEVEGDDAVQVAHRHDDDVESSVHRLTIAGPSFVVEPLRHWPGE
jgi:hypothetical protein